MDFSYSYIYGFEVLKIQIARRFKYPSKYFIIRFGNVVIKKF